MGPGGLRTCSDVLGDTAFWMGRSLHTSLIVIPENTLGSSFQFLRNSRTPGFLEDSKKHLEVLWMPSNDEVDIVVLEWRCECNGWRVWFP